MDSLISQLDKKYQDFDDSFTDKAYRFSFDYAYAYLDILENQPKIKEILKKTPSFLCYAELHKDIYVPMSKYKTSPFTPPQEIIGNIQIYPHFRLMISVWLVKHTIHLFPFLKTKNRDFNSYVAIQKVIHNIRQKKYQMYFKQLHENLILLILKISSEPSGIIPKINNLKIKIIIDDKKGIFKADNDKLTYPIERKSKRMTIIKHLLTKDTISLHELMTITGQTDTVVMKSITEINQLFREKLKVAYDLILKNPTGGYSLNKTDFDIRVN